MKTKSKELADAINCMDPTHSGFTKGEMMAMHLMSANRVALPQEKPEVIAEKAVADTKALIDQLNKDKDV